MLHPAGNVRIQRHDLAAVADAVSAGSERPARGRWPPHSGAARRSRGEASRGPERARPACRRLDIARRCRAIRQRGATILPSQPGSPASGIPPSLAPGPEGTLIFPGDLGAPQKMPELKPGGEGHGPLPPSGTACAVRREQVGRRSVTTADDERSPSPGTGGERTGDDSRPGKIGFRSTGHHSAQGRFAVGARGHHARQAGAAQCRIAAGKERGCGRQCPAGPLAYRGRRPATRPASRATRRRMERRRGSNSALRPVTTPRQLSTDRTANWSCAKQSLAESLGRLLSDRVAREREMGCRPSRVSGDI